MKSKKNSLLQKGVTKTKIKESKGDRLFNIFNFIFVSVIFIIVLYPLIYVVSSSISSPEAVISNQVRLFPVGFSLEGYRAVFAHGQIVTGFLNSFWYVVVGTAINIAFTLLAAYPLSRKDFADRNIIMKIFAFTMMFSGGMIPTFLLVRDVGLLDTRWAMVIPNAFTVFNVIVARTFFQNTIPDELLESSKLDGCSDFGFLRRIVMPLSGTIIAVLVLFYSLAHWNTFFNALLYLRSAELFPLQVILRNILLLNQMDMGMLGDFAEAARREWVAALLRYSLIVVSSLPFMVLYPFVQKFFVKGMLVGAVKG